MYNIDFFKLLTNLLPHFLRGGKMLAWLQSLIQPVVDLYAAFLSYRDQKLYEAKITGQVISMEKMLNDAFWKPEFNAQLIYIADSDDNSYELLIYNKAENEAETFIYNSAESTEPETLLYNKSEGDSSYDFFVYVDVAIDYDVELMISMINKYKLAGTTYQIITVQ